MKKPPGYTLIEILIVLFIMSIVAGAALLSIGHNKNKQLETVQNELAERLNLAEEEAMLKPAVLGLVLEPHGFYFVSYQKPKKNKPASWIPVQDAALSRYTFSDQIELSLLGPHKEDQEDAMPNQPQIIISPNGELTPFTLHIGMAGVDARYAMIGEADGSIEEQNL